MCLYIYPFIYICIRVCICMCVRVFDPDPPKVTSLTVDGHEVNGTHLINEGQEVTISCSFNPGNPPVNFRLVDKTRELAVGAGRNYSLSIQCEDNWPRVNCEGNGSAENRTVSFLLKCK